jgi:hypothetical protein
MAHREGDARKTLEEVKRLAKQTYVQPLWLAVIRCNVSSTICRRSCFERHRRSCFERHRRFIVQSSVTAGSDSVN